MPYSIEQLRRGLESVEFIPYFQPIVDLGSGSIHGFEILARWDTRSMASFLQASSSRC